MEVSYKIFISILNNIINMSGNNVQEQDYALKVAYVANAIFEQKGYSKKECQDLVILNMLKYLTQPSHLLFEEALNDIVKAESTKNYHITKGIMDYCPEFDDLPLWKEIIKNQNTLYANYQSANCPDTFPKEIFTMRFAEKVVLSCENLRNINRILSDYENSANEDVDALEKADYKQNIFENLKTDAYKEKFFSYLEENVPQNEKLGVIKAIFIALDFKSPITVYHSALMFQICNFIAKKINLKDTEFYILKMCAYIANIGAFIEDSRTKLTEEPTKEETIAIINRKIIGINEAFRNVPILNYKQTLCKQFEYNDGSGYPLGLQAEDLNVYSKILTIANRICEMYEATPYSKGTNINSIYTVIKNESNHGKLEERFVLTILNNKQEFLSEISNIIFARKQLYNDLVKNKDGNKMQDFSSLKLLVVEDSDLDWMVFSKILSVFKIKADRATDGKMALDMINKNKKYDIIFMDIQMPALNGHETTKAIRALKNKDKALTPIYAVTADTFSGSITTCINSGMNGHFPKPIDINRLVKVLEHIDVNKTGKSI